MALGAYIKTCARHTPGNQRLILFEANEVDQLDLTAEAVTDLTLNTGKTALYAEFDIDGLKRIEEGVTTKGGLFYVTQKLEIHLSKSSLSLYNFISGLADQSTCGIGAIVVDSNGEQWLMGAQLLSATSADVKGLYMSSSNFDSGMAINEEDTDKYVVTLERVLPNYSLNITGTIQAATAGVITTTIIQTS